MAISFPLKNQEEEDEKKKKKADVSISSLLSTLLFAFPQSSLKINRPSVCIYL